MKPEWIRGRFRGVYSAPRGPEEGARRLPIEIERAELADVEAMTGPGGDDPTELRFEKLRAVKLAATREGPAEGERTLFDVRVRSWRLLYPAESQKRVYGTLVGELTARLSPEPSEPKPLALARAPEPEPREAPAILQPRELAKVEPPAVSSLDAPPVVLPRPEALPQRRDDTTSEQDLERLLWLVVPLILGVVGLTLAIGCGPENAAIWLAPLACAIAIRQTPSRYRIQHTLARRWLGGLCVLVPLFLMLGHFQTQWAAGCRPSIREQLFWLAIPVVGSALIRTQVFVWMSAVVWTTTLLGWCSLDGTCGLPTASASAALAGESAARPTSIAEPPLRTDADGHWPVSPGATHEGAPPASPLPAREREPARGPSPRREGAAASGPGAWIAPSDDLERTLSRISLEQANRAPERFFGAGGARSVYVPTDEIFVPGRAELRRGGDITLGRLANLLKVHPEQRVVIEVHTDATGDSAAQRALSAQRAGAVSAWLLERGHLRSSQLGLEPLGAERPIVPPDGSVAEQHPNRRLEIRLADAPRDPP